MAGGADTRDELFARAGPGGGQSPVPPTDTGSGEEDRKGLILMPFPLWGMDGSCLLQKEIKLTESMVGREGAAGTGLTFPVSLLPSRIPTGTRKVMPVRRHLLLPCIRAC